MKQDLEKINYFFISFLFKLSNNTILTLHFYKFPMGIQTTKLFENFKDLSMPQVKNANESIVG